jgi:hypothetical protein
MIFAPQTFATSMENAIPFPLIIAVILLWTAKKNHANLPHVLIPIVCGQLSPGVVWPIVIVMTWINAPMMFVGLMGNAKTPQIPIAVFYHPIAMRNHVKRQLAWPTIACLPQFLGVVWSELIAVMVMPVPQMSVMLMGNVITNPSPIVVALFLIANPNHARKLHAPIPIVYGPQYLGVVWQIQIAMIQFPVPWIYVGWMGNAIIPQSRIVVC